MSDYMQVRILKTPPGTDLKPGIERVLKRDGEGFCVHGFAERLRTAEFPGSVLWEPPPPPPEEPMIFVEPPKPKRKRAKNTGDS